MSTTHRILALATVSAISITSGAQAALLLQHTFDGGTGSLNGTALDTNNISASTWVAGAGITADGAINIADFNTKQPAYIDLGASTIGMGSADDIYELEVVVDSKKINGSHFTAGFWGNNPGTASNHDGIGSAWLLWSEGSIGANTGYGYTFLDSGSTPLAASGGFETFTIQLDMTDATLGNNSMSFYLGDSATGTLVGSAGFSDDEGFRYVGFAGRNINDTLIAEVQSLTLTQIPEPSSSTILLGLSAIAMTALGRRRKM
jgi:hypothetical protein